MRRLVIALAICVFSAQVHALGLGKLRVSSALDEPLRAEIELTSVGAGDLAGLEATLGTREDFARAGVQRPAYLQALKFNIDGSKSTIVVTTKQPAKEPFLHFVVAVQWSGGKLVREYTALLDPPLYAKEQPAPVSSPKTVDATAAMPASEAPPAPAPAAPGAVASRGDVRTGEYGPTVEGDTLWSIASKLDTAGTNINIFQIMLALQRENPDAFIDSNINLLKTGQTLRVNNVESIGQISKQEATVAYQSQLQEWQAKGGVAPTTAEVAMPSARPSDMAGTTGAEKGKEKDVLRIVQATLDKDKSKSGGASNAAEVQSLKDQITTLEDSLASRELENKELRERVTLLEDQVKNAKRLMEIESAGLAMAQKQAAEAETRMKEAQAAAEEKAKQAMEAEKEAEKAQQKASQAAAVVPPPAPKPQAVKAPPPAPKPKAAQQAKAQPKQKTATQRVSSRSRKPEKSWWESTLDTVLGGDMLFTGAIIAAVIVLAIGGLLFLRRRRSIAEFEESILTGTALDGHTDTTESADGGGSDTSFLSDFGLGGMGSVQADEVDPLAEAEVYLAYGRDEQAEEVLREATTRNPDRYELKLKLLEIYQQRNDVKSFETLAEELYPASGSGDVSVWRKVVEMGKKVSPENPLFSQEVPVAPSEDSSTTTTTTTTITGGADDLLAQASAPAASGPDEFPMPDATLELDEQLDEVSGLQQSVAAEVADTDTGENKAAKTSTDEFPAPTPPELDFDLDLDEAAATGSTEQQAVSMPTDTAETDLSMDTLDEMSDLDFDLGEDIESPTPGAPDTTAVHAVASTDTAEITGFDLVDSENIQTGADEVGADSGDQEQWDDAATKLDLAKAYIDMGDKAGARSIIDEVLKEGNPAQREQAGQLAAQIQ